MKVETIEMFKDKEFLGYAALIKHNGKKFMYVDDNSEPLVFNTAKEAKIEAEKIYLKERLD